MFQSVQIDASPSGYRHFGLFFLSPKDSFLNVCVNTLFHKKRLKYHRRDLVQAVQVKLRRVAQESVMAGIVWVLGTIDFDPLEGAEKEYDVPIGPSE